MQLHLPRQLVDLLERMAFILRRQEERTQVAAGSDHQHGEGNGKGREETVFYVWSLQSVVIRGVRLGVIRRGQRRHLEPIDCVEVEKALDSHHQQPPLLFDPSTIGFSEWIMLVICGEALLTLTFVATSLGFIFAFHSCASLWNVLYGPSFKTLRQMPKVDSSSYVMPMSTSSACT